MSFERLLLQKRRPRHLGYIRPVFSPYPWEKAQFIKCFPFRYEYLILDPQNPQKKIQVSLGISGIPTVEKQNRMILGARFLCRELNWGIPGSGKDIVSETMFEKLLKEMPNTEL